MSFEQIISSVKALADQNRGKIAPGEDVSANIYITGSSPGVIGIRLSGGNLTVDNTPVSPSDAQITASADAVEGLMSGSLNPALAVMSGKVKISGNIGKIMRLISNMK